MRTDEKRFVLSLVLDALQQPNIYPEGIFARILAIEEKINEYDKD